MILCCGEALIDMLPAKTVDGKDAFAPHCGGSVFNTAIALGRLGVETGLMTGLSSDMWGMLLRAELDNSGVDVKMAVPSDRPTTLAFVQFRDGQAQYSFHDDNSASRMIETADHAEIDEGVSALFLGGISLCNPPFNDTLTALAEAQAGRRIVMLDPNIRPGFIADADEHRARLTRLISSSDIVKVSDEDLDWIYAALPDTNARIRKLLSDGPALLLLTRGGEGATAYLIDGRRIEIHAKPVDVVDTVGAGDTFNAGFLAKSSELGLLDRSALTLAPDDAIKACLTYATKVAAVTVSRAGANPPWARELTN